MTAAPSTEPRIFQIPQHEVEAMTIEQLQGLADRAGIGYHGTNRDALMTRLIRAGTN